MNFVMLLGWAPKDNRELFSLKDFVKSFDPSGFQKSNPFFNRKKLDWFNGYYIRQKSDGDLSELLGSFAPKGADKKVVSQITPLIKERIGKLSDFDLMAGFFFARKSPKADFFGKDSKNHLNKAEEALTEITEWNKENIEKELLAVIDKNSFKTGDFFMDLRVAITGSKITPPINESMVILGKEETLKRLKEVI